MPDAPGGRFFFYLALMEITHEKACLCALNRIFGFEPKIALALIAHFGSASGVFALRPEEADRILGPHSKYKGCICARTVENAWTELEQLKLQGTEFIGWSEDAYPALLKECEDAPSGLYLRTSSRPTELWNRSRFISVVGTRDLSPYGKEWCERLIHALADAPEDERPVIVSGLAIGTDICAHRTALECGLPTMAVMATGPDSIYPARHIPFAERIAGASGSALVTDYPPGTAPLPVHFLRRNRIIAGLSEATVLIESKIKGGGMMTARLADSYNREVFALPGRVDDLRSQGCNFLIRSRTAHAITSINDFINDIGMTAGKRRPEVSCEDRVRNLYKGNLPDDRISQMSGILLAIRQERGITIDEIAAKLGVEYHKISQLTGMLETDGIITVDLLQRCFINFR